MTEAEKGAVSVVHAASVGGHALSLNFGIRRESALLRCKDPRRSLQKHLNKHLNDAGFHDLPITFCFDVAPADANGRSRAHLHGVVALGMTDTDLKRLGDVLTKAASPAIGAIGGERQFHWKPIHDAEGWIDYMVRAERRTKNELKIANIWLLSRAIKQATRETFERLRAERAAQTGGAQALYQWFWEWEGWSGGTDSQVLCYVQDALSLSQAS
ncbi:hypothetical protein [Paracoccus aestuariivivens]|uniref:Replication protein n=1 Tax=Paracoccus aestuariivivens TaxID=1820333 RepID=A0A6L6J6H0_9RHOB|nr:hypothetical protein [Paracoccus aestuariivivens]MTH77166.1 hypothetical protein [Paracoccus aestuariivivens]